MHFAIMGVFIFAAFQWIAEDTPEAECGFAVEITTAQAAALSAQYEATWKRLPTEEELETMLIALGREEVLLRVALILSLDKNDTVVRRRMAQKMEFLVESAASAADPTDADLQHYYDLHKADFAPSREVALEQVFLGHAQEEAVIASLKSELKAGRDPAELGIETLLPEHVKLSSARALNQVFGPGFGPAVMELTPGEWEGPVRSGYGLHLVKITQLVQPDPPTLQEIRAKVQEKWIKAETTSRREAILSEIEDTYTILYPGKETLGPLHQ